MIDLLDVLELPTPFDDASGPPVPALSIDVLDVLEIAVPFS